MGRENDRFLRYPTNNKFSVCGFRGLYLFGITVHGHASLPTSIARDFCAGRNRGKLFEMWDEAF